MAAGTSELERRLRTKPDDFVFKHNYVGKSEVWKHFALIFEKDAADGSLQELKYFCVCNSCRRVYLYKAADGSSFGTKNLLTTFENAVGSRTKCN